MSGSINTFAAHRHAVKASLRQVDCGYDRCKSWRSRNSTVYVTWSNNVFDMSLFFGSSVSRVLRVALKIG